LETVHIGVHPLWHLFGLTFHSDTLISAWVVSVLLIAAAVFIRIILRIRPGLLQSAVELGAEALNNTLVERIGERGRKYFPFLATLFLFIITSNWLGVTPFELKSPTADLNTTAGLALLTIFLVQVFGMIEKGPIRYFKRFFQPNPVFFPLNVIEELAKPLSLSIRLFGNIFGKETIIVILSGLVALPLFYPIPILALSLLIGAIQAYIFMLLAVFYISMALAEEGH
jgi:F-type H+-transporting ATPase subunit a